jgi:hypothetical protein
MVSSAFITGVAACGHHRQQREVREPAVTGELLRPHHPLHGGQPHHVGRSRVGGQRVASQVGGDEGEAVRRVRGDLGAPDRGQDLVLVHGAQHRMRAQRGHRGECHELEVLGQQGEQRVLGGAQPLERDGRWRHEPVLAVLAEHVGRGEPVGPAAHHAQQQSGQVGTGRADQPFQHRRAACRPDHTIRRRRLTHGPCLPSAHRVGERLSGGQ